MQRNSKTQGIVKRILFGDEKTYEASSSLVFAGVRVVTGLFMAFGHGIKKMPPPEPFVDGVMSMGLPFPFLLAWSASVSELIGGVLLAAGFLTRPSAFFIASTMFVAAVIRHAQDPFRQKELAFLYLVLAVFFVVQGGGKWSIDRFFRRSK